jgi:hypothetical protein
MANICCDLAASRLRRKVSFDEQLDRWMLLL